ncbi:MAG: hypothetical protein COA43_14025 [Robiginitomaculum sp.]|nr:MAG: hypothetical protein COA43_14025 [Robiginitomaculum sp.]
MLQVYGHFMSMPANKVRLCVSYLKFPHDYNHVDLQKGEHQTPEYLEINPAGRVPAINDDGFKLSQSDAICKYVCALSGPSSFYPDELQEKARVDEWNSFASAHIMPAMGRIFFNKVVASLLGEPSDEASIATGEAMLARDLPMFEAKLQENDYLLGDHITLADITFLVGLEPAEMVQLDLSAYPAIIAWRKTIMARDFYQRVHMHFGAEMGDGT